VNDPRPGVENTHDAGGLPEMSRLVRNTTLATVVMAAGALAWRPAQPAVALGVVGGGVLAGLSFWGLRGVVDQLVWPRETGEIRPISRVFQLVKFFTRYVILALAAYVMMLRLRLDPVGMIVGVTSAVVAAAFEARQRR
jgi:ATP synthase I chain